MNKDNVSRTEEGVNSLHSRRMEGKKEKGEVRKERN